MQITNEIKQRVVDALTAEQAKIGKGSNEYATYIENMLQIPFNKSAYSQIKQPKGYAAIKDATWLKLAKYFNCLVLSDWQTAKTNTYISVQTALELCRENGLWQVLCDIAGIGKSYAANEYAQANKGSVIYVDCSDCQSKSEFILELARQLGIEHTSTPDFVNATLLRKVVPKVSFKKFSDRVVFVCYQHCFCYGFFGFL